MARAIGIGLLAISLSIVVFVIAESSTNQTTPLVFSDSQMLGALWRSYKNEYVEPGTFRTLDKQRDNITTSEGQSYTMLRAVWMGDKETFDGAWNWTRQYLDRPNDNLFSWLYGKRSDGTFGVLTEQNGDTTASDADTDIALALIFAYARWQDQSYLESARAIISDIWDKEVIVINNKPYLLANSREKEVTKVNAIVNPSYLAPYAYRIFAKVDPEHPWNALVDSSYEILYASADHTLDTGSSAGLPPDWVAINRETGVLHAVSDSGLSTNYGYDAMRTPWRLALDWKWFGEPRAKELLASFAPLANSWKQEERIATVYSHDGRVIEGHEAPAAYGGNIGRFLAEDPYVASQVYQRKLRSLYNPDTSTWRTPLSYYDDNWAWFGIALYTNSLPNLALSSCPLIMSPDASCFQLTAAPHMP